MRYYKLKDLVAYLQQGLLKKEEVGFEPTVRSHVRRFSRPLQSTALALLQSYSIGNRIYITQNIFFCKEFFIISIFLPNIR